MDLAQELEKARTENTIVGIQRRKEDQTIGFVACVNESFVLLHEVLLGVQLDGFHVMRIDDLCAMQIPYEHHDFAQHAMARRGDSRSELDIDLGSWHAVIESTRHTFPIGRYEFYSKENDFYAERVCGRTITLNDKIIAVRPIDEGGNWQKGQAFLSLDNLTKYSFGGQREQFLAECAREHTPVGPQHASPLDSGEATEGDTE